MHIRRHMRRGLTLVSMVAVASLTLSACSSSSDTDNPASDTQAADTSDAAPDTDSADNADDTPDADGGQDEKTVQVAFFAPSANAYVEATLEGMQRIADEQNAEITRYDTGFDPAKQYSQLQDAIAEQRFDAFMVMPLDAVGLVPVVEEAIAEGIQVVNTNLALGPETDTSEPQVEGQAGTVIAPPMTRGVRMADSIIRACEDLDPCNVGYIFGDLNLDFEQAAKTLVDAIPDEHPNINIVATQAGHGYVASDAIGITQNMLQAHPEINVLMLTADQATIGAQQVIEDAGLMGEIRILSSGATCDGVAAVESGDWYSTTIDVPQTEGELGMKLAIAAARGTPITPNGLDGVAALNRDPILTKDTLDGFTCEYNG